MYPVPEGLMARLAEIMPKKPEPVWPKDQRMILNLEPIRYSAEVFLSWLGDDLPQGQSEVLATLWVFGELLCGDMEKMINQSFKIANDLAACTISPVRIMDKEVL
jgi:hypothetical protein